MSESQPPASPPAPPPVDPRAEYAAYKREYWARTRAMYGMRPAPARSTASPTAHASAPSFTPTVDEALTIGGSAEAAAKKAAAAETARRSAPGYVPSDVELSERIARLTGRPRA